MSNIEQGEALVRKWARRFGLGDFRLRVQLIDSDCDAWARSFYELNEEWGLIELPPDALFPPATLEMLVLHELAHGLLALAERSEGDTEAACNRIARLAKQDYESPLFNEHVSMVKPDEYWSDDKKNAAAIDRRAWVPLVADGLPKRESVVISLIYWDGLSLEEAGKVLGVSKWTVMRVRDSALKRMQAYFTAIEEGEFECRDSSS